MMIGPETLTGKRKEKEQDRKGQNDKSETLIACRVKNSLP